MNYSNPDKIADYIGQMQLFFFNYISETKRLLVEEANRINATAARGVKVDDLVNLYNQIEEKLDPMMLTVSSLCDALRETSISSLTLYNVLSDKNIHANDVAKPDTKEVAVETPVDDVPVQEVADEIHETEEVAQDVALDTPVSTDAVDGHENDVIPLGDLSEQNAAIESVPVTGAVQETVQDSTPVTDATQEVAQDSTPVTDAAPEVAQDSTPVTDAAPEVVQDSTPVTDVAPEVAQDSTPVTDVVQEVAQDSTPVTDVAQEVSQDSTPVTDVVQEAAQDSTPVVEEPVQEAVIDSTNVEGEIPVQDVQSIKPDASTTVISVSAANDLDDSVASVDTGTPVENNTDGGLVVYTNASDFSRPIMLSKAQSERAYASSIAQSGKFGLYKEKQMAVNAVVERDAQPSAEEDIESLTKKATELYGEGKLDEAQKVLEKISMISSSQKVAA